VPLPNFEGSWVCLGRGGLRQDSGEACAPRHLSFTALWFEFSEEAAFFQRHLSFLTEAESSRQSCRGYSTPAGAIFEKTKGGVKKVIFEYKIISKITMLFHDFIADYLCNMLPMTPIYVFIKSIVRLCNNINCTDIFNGLFSARMHICRSIRIARTTFLTEA